VLNSEPKRKRSSKTKRQSSGRGAYQPIGVRNYTKSIKSILTDNMTANNSLAAAPVGDGASVLQQE